jgi:16S rRNA (cytosine967-C5)-methyltransferase
MTTENNKNEKVEDTKEENKKKDIAVEKISEPQEQNPAALDDDPMAIDEPKDITVSLQNPDHNFPYYHNVDKRIFNNARALAVKILVRCERSDAYLDKLIDFEIRNNDLNDLDKALLNELAHGVIRWLRRIDWFLNGFYRGQYEKCLSDVKNAMRVALYQILFLNKIPYSAAVNEAVEFIKKLRGDKHAGVVNGLLRTIIRTLDSLVWPSRDIDEVNYLGIVQSHPNWMVRRWVKRFGFDDAEKLCEANNQRPSLTLRVNKTKISTEELEKYLEEKGIVSKRGKYLDYFLHIKMMSKIYNDEFFQKGYFNIQDESAGLMSQLLNPNENDLVLDVCAAPGGKSSHISELMSGKGKIISIDKYLTKVDIMKKNFERLNMTNVLAFHENIHNPKTELLKEKLINKVDKVLVDAPCTGLGVITKKPDIKWKREAEDILKLQTIQLEILERASEYVKDNGVLVYSTCTTEIEENSDVINKFLEKHPDFKIDNAVNYVDREVVNENGFVELFPHIHNIDGAFGARLVKIN